MITQDYVELLPSYGREYKNKAQAEEAFRAGLDFEGDYTLGFRKCSVRDFAPGTKVNLRYRGGLAVVTVRV